MRTIHLLKPRLDASHGAAPSVKEQQAGQKKKKKKGKPEDKESGEDLFENEDGGLGSGPRAGGLTISGKQRTRAQIEKELARKAAKEQAAKLKEKFREQELAKQGK